MSRQTCLCMVIAVCFAASIRAQSTFGSFVGAVRDASGAPIAGAMVRVTNTGTTASRNTLTESAGEYVVVNLEPGSYEIQVQAPGFQISKHAGLSLLSRQTVRVDVQLGIASQSETVNITESIGSVISTDVSNIAETRSGRELMDLPVAIGSRAAGSTSPISTLTTQPGVQTDAAGGISVAGAKPSMLSMSIDGISTMSVRTNAPLTEMFPSFAAIAEIRVSEINNAAEFGGVSDITTVSKSGTNQFHGGLFHNLQNTLLNARNPFLARKQKTIMNNFGVYAGGPVLLPKLYSGRDKTFFFASYEGLRLPRETFINQSVPSVALRSGDLSIYPNPVRDPDTGAPFPGNRIPASRISPFARNALERLYAIPNAGAPNAIANNFSANLSVPINSDQGDLRVDQTIGANQNLFVRGTYKLRTLENAPVGTVMTGTTTQDERNYAVTLAHNYIIRPTLVNELRIGLTDLRLLTGAPLSARELISSIGIPVPDPPDGAASPVFTITGFQSTNSTSSSVSRSKTLQILDNLTYTRGRHTLKAGGDIRRLSAYFSNVFSADRSGRYTFSGALTNSLIGNPFGAFLLGIPDTTGIGEVKAADSDGRSTHYAFYAQDDWKVTPRLTINYGLRWEYHPPFLDRLHNMAVMLPDVYSVVNGVGVRGAVGVPDQGLGLTHPNFAASIAPTPVLTASQAGIPQTLHYSQRTSFAPRIGFAWRPFANGKTVIRGGYGRFIEAMLGTLTSAGWAVSASNVGTYTNRLVNGVPELTLNAPFPAVLAQPGTQNFRLSADVNYRDPYVHQWNLTVERDIGFNTGVRVSYEGSNGVNLGYIKNLAQVPANTVGFQAARSSSPFPLWARIAQETTGARSNYHAMTIAANKRLSKGVMLQSSYVFAKNLSNGQGFNPTAYATQAGGYVTDAYNIGLDYGPVTYTRRHRFMTNFIYELPLGRGKTWMSGANRWVDALAGGWQLAGILVLQTGPFLTVVAPGSDPMGTNFANLEGAGRADIVPGVPLYPETKTIQQWINPAAFRAPANNIGRAGNSSVGSVVGPGTQLLSLSMFKTVAITESVSFQIGAAASNALNHPNYAPPANLNVGTAAFGSINNVQTQEGGGPRSLQLTARITF
jgi:hypothetical protein